MFHKFMYVCIYVYNTSQNILNTHLNTSELFDPGQGRRREFCKLNKSGRSRTTMVSLYFQRAL